MNAEQFLQDYANALNRFDPQLVKNFWLAPTVIMQEHSKKIMMNNQDIVEAFKLTLGQLQQHGVAKMVPELQQNLQMSDTLSFSKLSWQFFDKHGSEMFQCASSHTLQKMPNGELRIIVIVVEDTQDALAKIFPL
ncbi:DUF6841 family protein [Paraglaciecola aestuariivivens]